MKTKYSIAVPVFNEEKIIEGNIEKLYSFLSKNCDKDFEIIIGDDGSTDKTNDVLNKIFKKYKNILVVKNEKNTGRGSILSKCFSKSSGKIVAYIDADLEIDISLLPALFKNINNGYDVAIGSKHLKKSDVKYGYLRKILSKSYSSIAKIILKCQINDYQCGMKAFNKNSFLELLPCIKEKGWAWDTEVLALAYYKKMKIKELPATVLKIKNRKSKVIIFKDAYNMLNSLFRIRKNVFSTPNKTI